MVDTAKKWNKKKAVVATSAQETEKLLEFKQLLSFLYLRPTSSCRAMY
jgi:hypothetical protein